MKPFFASALLVLAGCSAQDAPPPAPPSWADDLQAFCEAQQPGWLMSAVDRIDRALPAGFARGSTAFQGMNLQAPFDGRPDARELQLRLAAQRAGAAVQLSAYALVEPDSCALGDLHVIEGFDRFDPPLRVEVPAG